MVMMFGVFADSHQVGRWPGGQVGKWAGGQVDRWPGGQVDRWGFPPAGG